jgi:hypothetical protein
MPLVKDFLKDSRVVREFNARKKDYKKQMYLTVLALARETPYDGWNAPIDGLSWFQVKQLYKAAGDWGIELPDYTHAVPYLTELAKSNEKLVTELTRQERVGHPFAVTDVGYQYILERLYALAQLLERKLEFETMRFGGKELQQMRGLTMIYLKPSENLSLTIGRVEQNDWSFPKDKAMSRRHSRIFFRDNKFWIEDLNSTNGTWKIDESAPYGRRRIEVEQIHDNDEYQLGNTRIKLHMKPV